MSDITDHDSAVRAEHYATGSEAFAAPAAPFAPEAGIGVSLSVGVFGFSVIMLGLAEAHVFNPGAASPDRWRRRSPAISPPRRMARCSPRRHTSPRPVEQLGG